MTKQIFGQRINIEMGASLLLNIEGIEGKFKSHLIGLVPSEFMIIKAPIGYSGIKEKLFEGNKVTVRYIQHGQAYGFESFIMTLVTKPKTMLILSYPTTINTVSLRKAERYDCYIPCVLEIEGQELTGTIMDISLKGCRCLLPELPSKIQRSVDKDAISGTLKFESPNNKDNIELSVLIVNKSDYKSASKIGLLFDDLDSEVERSLVKVTEFLEKH
jgi:c-di-GMP-binding flagellar brake protein YcgR